MKKQLPMLALAIAVCFVKPSFAQRIALAQSISKQKQLPEIQRERPLKEVLQALKDHYKADIVFFDRIVDGHMVPSKNTEWNGSLENDLMKILKPLGLEAMKGVNGGYIITVKKPVKEINSKAAPVQQAFPNVSGFRPTPDNQVLDNTHVDRSQPQREIAVKGVVTDGEKNEPLTGVSVVIKGTQRGTVTDINGNFSLDIPEPASVLVFSFVGYIAQEIPVGGRTQFNISLKVDQKALEEVVVMGYGSQQRATVTGSVVTLKGDDIIKTPVTNVSNSLTGRLPGVTTFQRSGEPGNDGSEIRIRGTNSLGNNSALIIVDGIPGRSLDRIDPNTIETITVLKDASAAIYGSQAANGVILITTKRGKQGKPEISFNYNEGFNQPTRIPKMANSSEYATMLNEIDSYNNRQSRYSAADIQKFADGSDLWGHPDTDWFKVVLKPRSRQNYLNATLTGGSEKIKYYFNVGSKFQDGYYKKSSTDYKQYDFRSNIDGAISENISVRFDVAGRIENRSLPVDGSNNIFSGLMRSDPGKHAFWPDGTPGPDIEGGNNPAVTSTDATGYDRDKRYVFNSNVRLDVKIPWIPGLALSGNASYDKTFRFRKTWKTPWYLYSWDGASYDPTGKPLLVKGKKGFDDPRLQQLSEDNQDILLNGTITYEKTIGKNAFKIMAGSERRQGQGTSFSAFRRNYVSSSLDQLFAGGDLLKDNTGSAYENARLNYFGRLNYNFNEKIMLEFVWRYDGSYIFPEKGRYGFFPGVSAGYRLSEEGFWKNNLKAINDFKVRASWGQTGNDRIAEWQYLSSYGFNSTATYVFGVTQENKLLSETRIPNENITWEIANQANIGFEAGLLGNRLTLEFDYFNNRRSQILWQRSASVPTSTGLTLPRENIGKVTNVGYEFNVGYRDQIKKLKYNVSVNGSYSKNKITFWDESPGRPEWQKSTGKPIPSNPANPDGDLYYESIGIFRDKAAVDAYPHWNGARPGDVIFKDVNNDGVINGNDRVRSDRTNVPRFNGGVNLGLSYLGFDVSVLLQGATGAKRYINTYSGDSGNFLKEFYQNRWTAENPEATEPRAFNRSQEYWRTQFNTQFVRNTDYLRIKTLQLGYTLPSGIVSKVGAGTVRVYVSGYNLFTYSPGLKDFDPESDSNEGISYPVQRVLNGGISLTF